MVGKNVNMANAEGESVCMKGRALDGGPQCRMSTLRNDNVPCHYLCNNPVNFRITQCCMSILRKGPSRVTNFISHDTRLHVACRF